MQTPLRRLVPPSDSSNASRSTGSSHAVDAEMFSIDDLYAAPLGAHAGRPWIGLSMVASIDGSTVVDGMSSALSGDNDSAVFRALRSIADVIVVGAGTVRGEGYGPPEKQHQRVGVVTRSGSVDTSSELFTSGAGFVITTHGTQISDGVDVIRCGHDDVDLHGAIDLLPTVCDLTGFVQVEGGPTLNAAFADADLFDELNLTMSPATVGGDGPRLTHGGGDHAHRYEIARMAIDDDSFVFTRWLRRRDPTSP